MQAPMQFGSSGIARFIGIESQRHVLECTANR
jgi:hypothetical protein